MKNYDDIEGIKENLVTLAIDAFNEGYDQGKKDSGETDKNEYEKGVRDAVSREAMLKGLARIAKANARSDAQKSLMGRVMFFTEHLPSVTPKQRTGHWVEIGDEPYDTWECNNCGFVIDGSGCVDPEEYRDIYKYCPNCGAKMEGVSE